MEAQAVLPTLPEVTAKLLMVEADTARGNESANITEERPFGGSRPRVYVPPHRRNNNYNKNQGKGGNKEVRKCYYCDKVGHIKRDCRNLRSDLLKKAQAPHNAAPAIVALTAQINYDYD